MNNVVNLAEDFQFDTDLIQIDEGDYEFEYSHHFTNLYKGRSAKLIIYLKVISQGRFYNYILPRYYNVAKVDKARIKNGAFIPKGPKSDFVREYTDICGRLPNFDSENLTHLIGKQFMGSVDTVSKGENGTKIPRMLRYSVVRRIFQFGE